MENILKLYNCKKKQASIDSANWKNRLNREFYYNYHNKPKWHHRTSTGKETPTIALKSSKRTRYHSFFSAVVTWTVWIRKISPQKPLESKPASATAKTKPMQPLTCSWLCATFRWLKTLLWTKQLLSISRLNIPTIQAVRLTTREDSWSALKITTCLARIWPGCTKRLERRPSKTPHQSILSFLRRSEKSESTFHNRLSPPQIFYSLTLDKSPKKASKIN